MGGLLVLLSSCAISLLLVVRSRLQRFEAIGLALFVLVVVCIALGGVLADAWGDELASDGRSLIACAVGPLMALLWRDAVEHRLAGPAMGVASAVLLFVGLAGQALSLHRAPSGVVVVLIALVLGAGGSGAMGVSTLRRAQAAVSRLHRHRIRTEALSALVLTSAAVGALVEVAVGHVVIPGAWTGLVAVAVCAASAARTAATPLTRRDVVVVVVAAALLPLVVPAAQLATAIAAVAVAVITASAVGDHGRAAVDVVSCLPPTPAAVAAIEPGLAALAPLFDDARQRHPQRPRVLSRTAARRLIEAATASAWRARANTRGRPPVDVSGDDDADLDGDPGELAEALCAVVDHALGELRESPRRVHIAIRATPQTIAFEVDDGACGTHGGETRPFLAAIDVERAGFGVGLARARLLIERHGGQLSIGQGEGAVVHVSLPRRVPKTPVGLA